jgi:outer membrane protein assembly factor BamB
VGGLAGVAGDEQYVFGSDANDRVQAWKIGNGELAWSSERFLHRGLSAPLVTGRTVVFGDDAGYLHFLDRETGGSLLRLPTDGGAIQAAPVRAGTTLLVVTRGGGVFAFRPE